jgi:prepilin-type N-terminal cleavage/methylation domain-containing protein
MHVNIKKGFSLIEVLLAVTLLAVIIVTVTGVFTGILISSKKSDKFFVATNLATKEMENIKLMSFDDISTCTPITLDGKTQQGVSAGKGYFPPYPPQPANLMEKVNGVTYYYNISTSYVAGTGNELMKITVKVYWDEKENEGKNYITLQILKAK